ncbi:unnamed protein product [Effrenium voratum]|uniref:Protein-serine/threonine kinase n=1 Tax=Effrenium voratum TaxID=2562239 RepID=A0AA36IN54_9DINO|nr:unnamed protein product [Effrenium voratum]
MGCASDAETDRASDSSSSSSSASESESGRDSESEAEMLEGASRLPGFFVVNTLSMRAHGCVIGPGGQLGRACAPCHEMDGVQLRWHAPASSPVTMSLVRHVCSPCAEALWLLPRRYAGSGFLHFLLVSKLRLAEEAEWKVLPITAKFRKLWKECQALQAVGSPAVPSQPAVESPAAPNQRALALPEENGEAQPSLTNTQDPLAVGIPGLQPANKLSVLDRDRMRKEPEKRLPSALQPRGDLLDIVAAAAGVQQEVPAGVTVWQLANWVLFERQAERVREEEQGYSLFSASGSFENLSLGHNLTWIGWRLQVSGFTAVLPEDCSSHFLARAEKTERAALSRWKLHSVANCVVQDKAAPALVHPRLTSDRVNAVSTQAAQYACASRKHCFAQLPRALEISNLAGLWGKAIEDGAPTPKTSTRCSEVAPGAVPVSKPAGHAQLGLTRPAGTYAAKHGYRATHQLATNGPPAAMALARSLARCSAKSFSSLAARFRPALPGSGRSNVALSEGRFSQLLEAEITTMSMQEARSLSLKDMMELATVPETLADILHEELPVRYARRISMLESLPEWRGNPSIRHVRDMYIKSFKELRMADQLRDSELRQCLAKIKNRHSRTNLLVQGFKEYLQQKKLSEPQINEWLNEFFTLRISTSLLISQFEELAGHAISSEADASFNPYQSFINTQCDPLKIAQHAADVIQKLCEQWYGRAPKIIVTDAGAVPFTFVPRYMFYILSELLKNSVRATVEHSARGGKEMGPVTLVVCNSKGITSIRVSDEGGGIPVQSLAHVWSYLYTTAQPMDIPITREGVDAPTELQRLEMSMHVAHSLALPEETAREHRILLRSPLAGLGCGLPLSRLYAEYLGGRMKLQTMPRYGTDVFVYLNSVGNSAEMLKAI